MSGDGTSDELAKEAVSTAVKLFLGPSAKVVSDVVGGTIGDRVEAWRKRKPAWQEINLRKTAERAAEIVRERGVEISEDSRPEHVEQILEASKDVSADDIREALARLLAAAIDPARQNNYRSEFVDIVKHLEPLDLLVLREIARPGRKPNRWRNEVPADLKRNPDDVVLAAKNLERLDCVEPADGYRLETWAITTPRGRLLLSLLD